MRKSFNGLSVAVQEKLNKHPYCGHIFLFRGRRGDIMRILWWDGRSLNVWSKRLEHGRFIWPSTRDGVMPMSASQLAVLLEGADWRLSRDTRPPEITS